MRKFVDKLGQFLVGSPSKDFFNISIGRALLNFFALVGTSIIVTNLPILLGPTFQNHQTSLAIIQLALYGVLGVFALCFLSVVSFRMVIKLRHQTPKAVNDVKLARQEYQLAKATLRQITDTLPAVGRRNSSSDFGQPQVAQVLASSYQPVTGPLAPSNRISPPLT